jgi:hypothetical protein
MTEPASSELLETQSQKDSRELIKFLREEAVANRKAQRDEADANRKLFQDTSKIVAIPLAVLLALAGIFFYHDVDTMKKAMQSQGEASAKAEIQKMDRHIDETLEAQFKSDAIKDTIQKAAVVATRDQAPGLIKEVITPEVKRAVASQSETIKEVASRAATDEVKSAIDPVVADVKMQALIARANADDAKAFDELVRLKNTGSPAQNDLVNGVIVNLQRHAGEEFGYEWTSSYGLCGNPSGQVYQSMLTSSLVSERKKAIGVCIAYMSKGQWTPKGYTSAFTVLETVGPMLMKTAFDDPSLSVRAEAIKGANWLFKGGEAGNPKNFDLLDTTLLKVWWKKSASNQAALALIAFGEHSASSGFDWRTDQIGLYDELQRLAKISPQPLAPELELLREQMRLQAANHRPSAAELAKQIGRDCNGVQDDLGLRLQNYRNRLEDERNDDYGLLELQYLETACTVQGQLLTQIAEYGVVTRSLGRRYAAVEIVNKTSGVSFDHYDSTPLEGWLKTHKDKTSQ